MIIIIIIIIIITIIMIVTHADRSHGGRVCIGVGLSLCLSAQYLKNRYSYDHQTWHANVPR